MKPHEELLHEFDSIVKEYAASRQETRRMLGGYAIGRWVPVEERLPEFKDRKWKGIFRRDDAEYVGVFNFNEFLSGDEWLELDLPSGKDEV